jgi:50S ribosomal protein L16 3-hydroxylase
MSGAAYLGGMGATRFLREYWQKKPLLIRNAFPNFQGPLTKKEVLELATRDEAESRLVICEGRSWSLHHGPFSRKEMYARRAEPWTVLVQDTQHFSHEAHAVLAAFRFIPHARVDDLMVSFAMPGAGVGPHYDSYDVFLIQGAGRRRWRISSQQNLALKPGLPLKIIARFKAETEYVLDTGDVLYLPPGYAHDGIAETECLTWSVGFRAPSQQELATAYLDYLRDNIALQENYSDPDLRPTSTPGLMDARMLRRLSKMLEAVTVASGTQSHLTRFLGRYLTEPKSHVFFEPPEAPLSATRFRQSVRTHGVILDLKSRFLYQQSEFFLNGAELGVHAGDRRVFRQLSDARAIGGELVTVMSEAAQGLLFIAYLEGFLHIKGPKTGGKTGLTA